MLNIKLRKESQLSEIKHTYECALKGFNQKRLPDYKSKLELHNLHSHYMVSFKISANTIHAYKDII